MFKRLIIATDLSASSYSLIKCLGGLKDYGAEECLLLQCLSVQETASIALSYTTAVLEENLHSQKEILEQQGFAVETRIVPGLAKDTINRIAVEENYSLIVVGAQVQSLTREVFFGGLAYDVIQHAQKPVLLIRLEDNPVEGVPCISSISCNISNHILFPTDFSENADQAFDYLEKMIVDGAKKVTILHVQDQALLKHYLEGRLNEFNAIDNERLQKMKERLQAHGKAEIQTLLLVGSPFAEIIKVVRELNIQLVVMGSQGRGYIKELFLGSVSHNIARHAPSSILLVPARRENE